MPYELNTAVVIGTGMMGPGIGLSLALAGLDVTILSRSEDGAAEGLSKARTLLAQLAAHGLVKSERAQEAAARIRAGTDTDRVVPQAGLVIESAPENLGFKQDLFRHLDKIAKPNAILTTNTSGLSITAIASACQRPERVLTTHFWNPPYLMPLVELVLGQATDPGAALAVKRLLERAGKVPVVVKKDTPGQLGNRLQMALWREAVHIVAEGIADPQDVDLAAKTSFGMRLPVYGIFEHADAVGLDMVAGIMEYVSSDLFSEKHAPPLIHEKVRNGHLGKKSGQGFYDWSKKDFDEMIQRRDRFLFQFLSAQKETS